MLFGTWLKAQRDRDSPIGDLSRDFLQSIENARAETIAIYDAGKI